MGHLETSKNKAVPERVDFSANANVYDHRHGAALSDEDLHQLWSAAALRPGMDVLDVGAGTGRVAIPLAMRGCTVVALEPARGMLDELRSKAGDTNVSLVIAEGGRLPFPSGRFHAVVMARLLYLTTDWSQILNEARRVLAPGGCLLHEWGNGHVDEEWARIREEARSLFDAAGIWSPFHPGVRSETEVDEALEDLGVVRETDVGLGPGPSITLREFLRRLTEGELSYIWRVPEQVRTDCLPRLVDWAERTFDLDRSLPMPREIRWTVYRTRAG